MIAALPPCFCHTVMAGFPCECRWRGKLESATLNSAPSSDHDVARAMDSILSRSAPPTPNIQNWPTPRPSNQNWPTPSTSNMQKSKPSIGRRTSRAFARYSIVFLIGIGVTLAWQSYGDEAMKMVRTEAPSLAWLLPVSTAKPPPDDQESTAAAASSPQLERLEVNLVVMRRSVEQLAAMVEQLSAKQDQMAQNIATLQSVEQEVSQKLSSPPQSRAVSPRKPPQPTAQSSATQSSSVPAPPPPTGQFLR